MANLAFVLVLGTIAIHSEGILYASGPLTRLAEAFAFLQLIYIVPLTIYYYTEEKPGGSVGLIVVAVITFVWVTTQK